MTWTALSFHPTHTRNLNWCVGWELSTTGNCQWPVGVWPPGPQWRNWHDSSPNFFFKPPRRPCLPCSPQTSEPRGPRPTYSSSEVERAQSTFVRVLISTSGLPPPASLASCECGQPGNPFPHQPSMRWALGTPRLPHWRGLPREIRIELRRPIGLL